MSGWAHLTEDEGALPEALYKNGPIGIAIDSGPLRFYVFGILPAFLCSSKRKDADHAVLLTGYGTEENIFKFQYPYWEAKNSWGADWGESGYFKMTRGWNTCGLANYATTAFLD